MDVVVDEVVAVLQVLSFADTVGGNEYVNLFLRFGKDGGTVFGQRREIGEDIVETHRELTDGATSFGRTRNQCRVQSAVVLDGACQLFI